MAGFDQWGALSLTQWQAYVRSVTARAGLRLVWSDDGSASTDGKTIRLPRPSLDWTRDEAQKLTALAVHESSHVQHSDMPLALGVAKDDPLKFKVFNIVEDDRIEAIPASEWAGDRQAFEATAAPTVERFIRAKVAQLATMSGPARDAEAKLLGVSVWGCQQRAQWAVQYAPGRELLDLLPQDVIEVMRKLDASGVAGDLNASRYDASLDGSRSFLVTAGKIVDLLGFTEAEKEAAQAGQVQGGGVGADKGEHEALFEGDEADLTGDVPAELSPEGKPSGKPYTRRGSGDYAPVDPHDYVIDDETRGKKTLNPDDDVDIPSEPADLKGVAGKVRRLLQIAAEVRRSYGHKSGRKLHGAALYRVPLAIEGFSERVFIRKDTALDLDIVAGVVIDASGSMAGKKIGQACLAGAAIGDVLGNILGIRTMMGLFSTVMRGMAGEVPVHAICRRLDERMVSKDQMLARLNNAAAHMMRNNMDGEAVAWMANALLGTKAKRRVLFVLSDGYPASYRPGDSYSYLKRVVEDAEKRGIEVWGIGIESDAVAQFYPKYRVLTEVSDLAKIVVELAGSQILNGGK